MSGTDAAAAQAANARREHVRGDDQPPLRCIVCDKQPEGVGGPRRWGPEHDQPYGAAMFLSYGQYGSTVFDPQDDSQLQINVCDECLIARAAVVWHARYLRRPKETVFSKPWDPSWDPT